MLKFRVVYTPRALTESVHWVHGHGTWSARATPPARATSAYIDTTTDANILKLQYTVSSYTGEGTTAHLYGKEQICAATSSDADKQKDYFSVDATNTTAVA
jgi:hypothetical protein